MVRNAVDEVDALQKAMKSFEVSWEINIEYCIDAFENGLYHTIVSKKAENSSSFAHYVLFLAFTLYLPHLKNLFKDHQMFLKSITFCLKQAI